MLFTMFHNVSAYKQSKEAIAMNRQFDFLMPSVNFFGPGVIEKIGDRAKMLGMHKVLVVTQSSLLVVDQLMTVVRESELF